MSTKKNLSKNTKKLTIFFSIALSITSIFFIANYRNRETEKPIVVVIPSYNNIKWYEKNLSMLAAQSQTYNNWRAIYIDDCSPDGTGAAVEKYIADHNLGNKITLMKNPQNMGAMYNLYTAIHTCRDEEIILTLDGDDWFTDNQVLKYINSAYQDGKTWMTYGQYEEYPPASAGISRQIPNFVIEQNAFRNYAWVSSQLRTFYAGLFKKIKKEDFMLDGKFFAATYDMAIMFPMLEMAGYHSTFTPRITYVYNRTTPINDNKIRPLVQRNLDVHIRNKTKYSRISSLN